MKFISLLLLSYLAYYLVNILLDLLQLQKASSAGEQAAPRLEIPLPQRVSQQPIAVTEPGWTSVMAPDEDSPASQKKSP
jgi:hypothetical protein